MISFDEFSFIDDWCSEVNWMNHRQKKLVNISISICTSIFVPILPRGFFQLEFECLCNEYSFLSLFSLFNKWFSDCQNLHDRLTLLREIQWQRFSTIGKDWISLMNSIQINEFCHNDETYSNFSCSLIIVKSIVESNRDNKKLWYKHQGQHN